MEQDEEFMKEAIHLSALAAEHGNEPFGAVLVRNGKIIFTNENQIYTKTDPTFHAEAGLIHRFCAETHITDLSAYTLYSSCEPCHMCSGALVWARIGTLVYGASNKDLSRILGVKGSECSKTVFEQAGYHPVVRAGVLKEESVKVLKEYFAGHSKG